MRGRSNPACRGSFGSPLSALIVVFIATASAASAAEKGKCKGDLIGTWKNIATDNEVVFNPDCSATGTECEYVGSLLNPNIGQKGVALMKLTSSNGKEDGKGGKCLAPGTHPCEYEVYRGKTPLEAKLKCGTDEPRILVKQP